MAATKCTANLPKDPVGLPEQSLKDPVRLLLGDTKARDHMSDTRTKSQTFIKALHSARVPLTPGSALLKAVWVGNSATVLQRIRSHQRH